jgi:hypothetical protein
MHHPTDVMASVILAAARSCSACSPCGRARPSPNAGAPRRGSMTTGRRPRARRQVGGSGLPELRQVLADQGITDPMWFEVGKSKEAPRFARKVRKKGAGLVFVWGGDGMVQRCMDELAGSDIPIAIVPAGTANLLATNLEIPADIPKAVADRPARRTARARRRQRERRAASP